MCSRAAVQDGWIRVYNDAVRKSLIPLIQMMVPEGFCRSLLESSSLPVSRERGEREHGHSHRSQLNERDQFAADAAKKPLIHQVTAGVYWGASDQEQQVTQSQTGEEEVGHRPQGLHRQTRLH